MPVAVQSFNLMPTKAPLRLTNAGFAVMASEVDVAPLSSYMPTFKLLEVMQLRIAKLMLLTVVVADRPP